MSFICYDTTSNKFRAREYKFETTYNGVSQPYYIDIKDKDTTILRLIQNNVVILSHGEFTLTQDEVARLDEVNGLVTSKNKNTYLANIEELDMFVKYGYVDPKSALKALKELSKKYVNVYRSMMVNDILSKLGKIRKVFEYAGLNTNYGLVETDPVSQGKISALFQANQIEGLLKSQTPFKMANGEFVNLDKDDINILYRKVADLIQNCFHAENDTINQIVVVNDEELISLWRDDELVREKFKNNLDKYKGA